MPLKILAKDAKILIIPPISILYAIPYTFKICRLDADINPLPIIEPKIIHIRYNVFDLIKIEILIFALGKL